MDREFSYLTRGTVAEGQYFIRLCTENSTSARTDGDYIVDNMSGKMMYDSQAMDQDFSLMPATQWVVEQLGCNSADNKTPYVKITNREYGNQVFEGQLYEVKTKDGKMAYKFIDKTYVNGYNDRGMFIKDSLSSNDIYIFTEVTSPIVKSMYHGYKKFTTDQLNNGVENNFTIKYNSFQNDNLYLKSALGSASMVAETGDATVYEIAEAAKIDEAGAIENVFGYPMDLKRTAYTLKVKDSNLIDNEKVYIALKKNATDGKWYYAAVKEAEIDGENVKEAFFYLKADQIHKDAAGNVTDTCYVLVDVVNTDNRLTLSNGWSKANVVDGLGLLRYSDLNDNPEDRASAFYFQNMVRKQYIDMTEDYDMPMNNIVKIYRKSGNAFEYLYEDTGDNNNVSASQDIADVNFLGIENKGIAKEDVAALYVDKVQSSKSYMPQYLFAVDVDSVADGFVCNNKTHGYWKTEAEAKAADENHYVAYNGYVAGRFLVNFTDSISGATNLMKDADLFKFDSYTRLGFVEGVHQVAEDSTEILYILDKGKTLAEIATIDNNSEDGKTVLDFESLKANSTANILDGTHKNYAFSLRKINDQEYETSAASEGFLMESNGEHSGVGSFEGAWVKIHNGIPVLAQITKAGNHEDAATSIHEVINQSQIFYFGETTDIPTANEEIAVEGVKVIAGEGFVTVKGATGKKITIANVLGQTVAKTVASSDDVQIAAPAGVVVVAVEGEAATKAIVK